MSSPFLVRSPTNVNVSVFKSQLKAFNKILENIMYVL